MLLLGLELELFIYARLFCGILPRLITPALIEIARQWQPDMFIRETGEYGAVIAAEHLGLPHAAVSFAAVLKTLAVFEQDAAAQLDPLRRRWGLSPDPTLAALYRYLCLAYAPPELSMHEVDVASTRPIPATARFIRPQFFDQAADEALPQWIAHLPPQPTIYVTLGTEANQEAGIYPAVLQTIIGGLRDLPINLIVTLGRGKAAADFGSQPDNVHIEPYIPQSLLLPHCHVMVMHGGSNSLLAAVDAGLPLVIVPLIADQFFNAYITERIGLGRVIQRQQLTVASIRAAVAEVIANPQFRDTAARLRGEMHALPDQKHAVTLIENVVAQAKPR